MSDLDAAGDRYRAAKDEWMAAREQVRAAILAERRARPGVPVAELVRRSGMERQAVYEVLGMKKRGGGRSRGRSTAPREVAPEPFEEAP